MRPDYQIPWPDMRRRKADMLTAMVMREVEPYLDRSEEALEYNVRRRVHEALHKLFWQTGADIVTDNDRLNAGLPLRDEMGYTAEELQVMEAKMMEARMHPLQGLLIPST